MMKTQEKNFETSLGTVSVKVSQLPAIRAGTLFLRLGKVLGPALANVSDAENDENNSLMSALAKVFETLTESELMKMSDDLLSTAVVVVNGEVLQVSKSIDLLFTGHVYEWFKLLGFALQVNYGDFSGALDDLQSSLPTTRAGTTGGSGAGGTSTGPQSA